MILGAFSDILRSWDPQVGKLRKVEFRDQKKLSRTPLFCLLSEPAAPLVVSGSPFIIFIRFGRQNAKFNEIPPFERFWAQKRKMRIFAIWSQNTPQKPLRL